MPPTAYLLTFGTYGSRLHGDARGTVDRKHNGRGEEFLPRDDFRRNYELRNMRGAPFSITPPIRASLDLAFEEAASNRGWEILALNIRLEHVHAVVAGPEPPGAMTGAFKAYGTRRLRETGLVAAATLVWARGGSGRHLRIDRDVAVAVDYVVNRQGNLLPGSGALHALGRSPEID